MMENMTDWGRLLGLEAGDDGARARMILDRLYVQSREMLLHSGRALVICADARYTIIYVLYNDEEVVHQMRAILALTIDLTMRSYVVGWLAPEFHFPHRIDSAREAVGAINALLGSAHSVRVAAREGIDKLHRVVHLLCGEEANDEESI